MNTGGVIGQLFGGSNALVVLMPELLQRFQITLGSIGEPMMHADARINLVDASVDDPLFIQVRIRTQTTLKKGLRAAQDKDIRIGRFTVSRIFVGTSNPLRPNGADGIGNIIIAGAAIVERGDQLSNAFLNLCHVICLGYATDRAYSFYQPVAGLQREDVPVSQERCTDDGTRPQLPQWQLTPG